ncbi:hypothetical protein HQN64_21200 [Enterobacteriaceae bacterium BIT-l23]|uniref:Uncharacterized protein n=1 Tax=Jejubacter calystegiae TaxID=2579935 RepID=A0A4P8YQZ1_9ENTR|nr:hypothetical protein [Jejubacter calystegiae]NUU68603.1 hypothetical protein [Enterobacteriaceae bacterium BIT-l23]QCT22274.1 hypothetical protein FEM41_22805 [Jejubacter calystegiae]
MPCRQLIPWLTITLLLTLPTFWYLSGFEAGEEDIWIAAMLCVLNGVGAAFIVRRWCRGN